MSKVYKVAIIGAGMIANAGHIPAYKNLGKEVEIVAIADNREIAAQETAKRHSIPKIYTDGIKMVNEIKPDIVSICTPNAYHKEQTIESLRSGAHVICEKPISLKYKDALEMFDEAKKAKKNLFACQPLRFFNEFMTSRDIVSSGTLGEIYYADVSLIRRRGIPKWGMFHMKEHSIGGAFCDLGVHITDYLVWITGNPKIKAVSGSTITKIANSGEDVITSVAESGAPSGLFTPRQYDPREFNVEEFASGSMRFEGGFSVNFKLSWAINLPSVSSGGISLAGTQGGIVINPPSVKIVKNMGGHQVDIEPKIIDNSGYSKYEFYGHRHLFDHILKVLKGEEQSIIKVEEVLNVAATIEAFYKSSELKHEVTFDDIVK